MNGATPVQRLSKLAETKLAELESRLTNGEEVRTRELTELKSVLQWCLAETRVAARDAEFTRLKDLSRGL